MTGFHVGQAPGDPPCVEELVAASLAGDIRARDELARWCLPRVRRTVLLSCGTGPDAEDLVQSAMFSVISKLDSFRAEARFQVWLDCITVNVVRGYFRRQRWLRLRLWEYQAEAAVHDRPGPRRPDQQVARQEVLDLLTRHLHRLKPAQRIPLVLHLLHGYTAPEIAVMLDLRLEATKKRLLRGRRMLLRSLKRDPSCLAMLGEVAS